ISRLWSLVCAGSLYFPARLGQPFSEDGLGGLVFGGVAVVVAAAFAGLPIPDTEAAQQLVAPPGAEEAFVQLLLQLQVDGLVLGVVPGLVGDVFLAEPADFGEQQRLALLFHPGKQVALDL